MNEKKVLPYKIPSRMLTYPYNAFYLGIIEANGIDIENILINDFTEIYYHKKNGIDTIDFKKSLTIEYNRFKTCEFPNQSDIISTIKDHINNGFYAIIMINQKFVKNKFVHLNKDFNHDWLIYGYDDNTHSFWCSGYIIEKQINKFSTIQLSYDEIESSMLNISEKYVKPFPSYFRNHFIKVNPTWIEDTPNIRKIYSNLKKILHFKIYFKKKFCFSYIGKYPIKKLLRTFKTNYLIKKKHIPIFLQNIRLIYDYRQNILLCLNKVNLNKEILDSYKTIVDNTYRCLLISCKYNLKRNEEALKKVYDCLVVDTKKEKELLKQSTKEIRRQIKSY